MKQINLATPHFIIMVGIPGSGKSFFAEHFSTTFNAPLISFEQISHIVAKSDTTAGMAELFLVQLLKTRQTIVYEGETSSRVDRQDLAKRARDNDYIPLFVWVQTESVAAKQRSTKQAKINRLTSDQFDAALRKFTPPNASEKAIVVSGKHTYASQLKIVLSRIASERQHVTEQRPEIQRPAGRSIMIR
ncbi:hypothetical protein BH10PAT4_BH10PAT4_0670 [soil metagenome]